MYKSIDITSKSKGFLISFNGKPEQRMGVSFSVYAADDNVLFESETPKMSFSCPYTGITLDGDGFGSANEAADALVDVVNFKSGGGTPTPTPEWTPLIFSANGETKKIHLTSAEALEWELVTPIPDWLTVEPQGGTENETVTVTAEPHTGREPRSAELTFKAEGYPDVVRPVIQQGKPEFVEFDPLESPLVGGLGGGIMHVTGRSNSKSLTFVAGELVTFRGWQIGGVGQINGVEIEGDPGATSGYTFETIISKINLLPGIAAGNVLLTATTHGGQTAELLQPES